MNPDLVFVRSLSSSPEPQTLAVPSPLLDVSRGLGIIIPSIMDKDVLHHGDHLFLKKHRLNQDSHLKIVDASAVPIVSYRMTVEVDHGFDLSFFSSKQVNSSSSTHFSFHSYRGNYTISERDTNGRLMIWKPSNMRNTIVDSLTEEEMFRLRELSSISKAIESLLNVEVKEDRRIFTDKKVLSLTLKCYNTSTAVAKMCNMINSFSYLNRLDQMIILKESSSEIILLRDALTFSREHEACMTPFFGGMLVFGIRYIELASTPHLFPLYNAWQCFIHDFEDYLRLDQIVMSLLVMLRLFQDRPGLREKDVVTREREIYLQIFQKYVAAKIASGECKTASPSEVWSLIYRKLEEVGRMKPLFENLTLASQCTVSDADIVAHDIIFG